MARKNKNRRQIKKGKDSYSLIVDGKTEVWYFEMLKKNEKPLLIDIDPKLPKKKTLKQQYEKVKEQMGIYDKVIWIVDYDEIIHNKLENKFKTYYKELQSNNRVEILVNNPCLEYWLLLHFKNSQKFYLKCDNVTRVLKKVFKGYKKTEKFYVRNNPDIYKKLKNELDKAIENAKKLGDFDIHNTHSAKAEIYKVFELLKIGTENKNL